MLNMVTSIYFSKEYPKELKDFSVAHKEKIMKEYRKVGNAAVLASEIGVKASIVSQIVANEQGRNPMPNKKELHNNMWQVFNRKVKSWKKSKSELYSAIAEEVGSTHDAVATEIRRKVREHKECTLKSA